MASHEARAKPGQSSTQGQPSEADSRAVLTSLPPRRQLNQSQLSVEVYLRPVSRSARAALEEAIELFNHEVSANKASELIDKRAQFASLSNYAEKELALRYGNEATPQRKRDRVWQSTKRGMEKFSRTIYNYKGVMDVLASAHPEIASLAWGAMKFLLAVSVNHQELREKIIENMAEIGDQFKVVDAYVRMFPEDDMVEHVCNAYAEFLTFLQLSIDWCKENAVVKFFKNVASPYDARIKPTMDSLSKCIKRIDARVQAHNAHGILRNSVGITDIQGQNMALQEGVNDVQSLLLKLGAATYIQSSSNNEILKLLRSFAGAEKGSVVELDAQPRHRIDSMPNNGSTSFKDEFAIKERIFPELLQAPDHAYERSIDSRRLGACHSHAALGLAGRAETEEWIKCRHSRLLWLDGYQDSQQSKWTTEFAVDVLLAAEHDRAPVLYYFGDLANNVLESEQVLQQYPALLKQQSRIFTKAQFQAARRSLKAAWTIFMHAISFLPKDLTVYLILDSADTVADLTNYEKEFNSLLRKISRLASARDNLPIVKALITSVSSGASEALFPRPDQEQIDDIEQRHDGIILRVPQTFGQTNVVQPALHLRQRVPQRLVRLPDSDEEFHMKPVNSFGFSDDENESIVFSSDESTSDSQGQNSTTRASVKQPNTHATSSKPHRASQSGSSSSDLSFSDGEQNKNRSAKNMMGSRCNIGDIVFSSDED